MKSLNLRLVLLFAFCGVAVISVLWFPAGQDQVLALESEPKQAEEAELLSIGSAAPELDVEHWVQNGNGFFKPVTKFEPGKVYVVEFWATWCGPCISSMPHLAELQNKLRGENVQIVSISDETLEEVTEFLKRKTTNAAGEETTFAEITAPYCLTTDPDRSAHEGYMAAAKQSGIPTAFIVGKDGKVEWIGHPMEMDEPLNQVIADSWNRNEFAELFVAKQSFTQTVQRLSQLAQRGRFPEAIEMIDGELAKKLPPEIAAQLSNFRLQIKMMGGMIDEDVVASFNERLKSAQGDAVGVARIAYSLLQAGQNPAAKEQPGLKSLMVSAIESLSKEVETADAEIQPLVLDTIAHLYESTGDLDAAIKAQEAGIERANPATKERLSAYLEQLKTAKESAAAEADK
jgi:thiol-disulfide isomerase/thioredoxin